MEKDSFQFKIESRPDFGFLTVDLPANESLKVEASSMATMDSHIKMSTKFKGGFSRFLTSESIFINEFKAEGAPGKISNKSLLKCPDRLNRE